MKTRSSLVSNSSSASFVILYRSLTSDVDIDSKEDAIKVLTYSNWKLERSTEELLKYTEHLKSDVFETKFHTSMMNSVCDFGDVAAQFFLELSNNDKFEIIRTRIEDHQG